MTRAREFATGLMIIVLTSRWFMVLDGLFMTEKRWEKRLAEVRELGRKYGLLIEGRSYDYDGE